METFFGFFHDLLAKNGESITFDELMAGEKYIDYNLGVRDFIKESICKNYIVSGGLKEFLDNLDIAKYFNGIYGTSVKHNEQGLISGIDEIMTDDKKILAIKDILKKNGKQENDCSNVYYIGDGYSDAVAMRFVYDNGGKAIFVYRYDDNDELYDHNNKIYQTLKEDGIVDFCCVADYRNGSEFFNILQRKNY